MNRLLERPRASVIEAWINQHFLAIFALLILAQGLINFSMTFRTTLLPPAEFTLTRYLTHFSAFLLVLGFSVFPANRRRHMIGGFLISFIPVSIWAFQVGNLTAPPALNTFSFLGIALLYNFVLGFALGRIAEEIAVFLSDLPLELGEDLSAITGVFLSVALLGTLSAIIICGLFARSLGLLELEQLIYFAVYQNLLMAVGMSMIAVIILFPPPTKNLLLYCLLAFGALFTGAVEQNLGLQTERVFTAFYFLALRFVLPPSTAILVTMLGLVFQSLIYEDATLTDVVDYLVYVSLLVVLLVCDLITLHHDLAQRRSETLRTKFREAVTLSKFGFFAYSSDRQQAWMDNIVSELEGQPFGGSTQQVLKRMPPEDVTAITEAVNFPQEKPIELTVRVSVDPEWSEHCAVRHFEIHGTQENTPNYGLVTIGTVSDVTGTLKTGDALRETLAKLEVSKENQHRLFSMISHELRTPASIIRMLTDQMNEERDWEKLGPNFNMAITQFMQLLDDLGSTLDEETLAPGTKASFHPDELVQNLASIYRVLAEERGFSIDLRFSQKHNVPRVTDVGRLQQILGNLTRNALLHSGGDHLILGYTEQTNKGELEGVWTVEDNGRGIPDALLPGLFDPFNRSKHGVFSRSDGSGLGMYIVKLFVTSLNGQIDYSRSVLGGAKFTVVLPLSPAAEAAEPAPHEPIKETHTRHRNLRVALVEDNPLVASVTQQLLLKHFNHVNWYEGAEDLLSQLQQARPDVVITDQQLPGLTGADLIHELRLRNVEAKLIMLSAGLASPDAPGMKEADGILTKPLSTEKLFEILD